MAAEGPADRGGGGVGLAASINLSVQSCVSSHHISHVWRGKQNFHLDCSVVEGRGSCLQLPRHRLSQQLPPSLPSKASASTLSQPFPHTQPALLPTPHPKDHPPSNHWQPPFNQGGRLGGTSVSDWQQPLKQGAAGSRGVTGPHRWQRTAGAPWRAPAAVAWTGSPLLRHCHETALSAPPGSPNCMGTLQFVVYVL